MKRFILSALALSLMIPATNSRAASTEDRIRALEKKLEALSSELERIKIGGGADQVMERPAAKPQPLSNTRGEVETLFRKVSIGGYGEMVVKDFSKRDQKGGVSGKTDTADALRAVMYFGYKYNDWIKFASEIEFEHGSTGKGRGEVSVEQLFLDFQLHEKVALRAGTVLVPMGFVNELHEPTRFHGVGRPSVETNIIPSTWRENGLGFHGKIGPVSYKTYALSGLQAVTNTGVTGFSASSGLRNGRSSGAKSRAEDPAWVARLDFDLAPGFTVGGSYYVGEADQGLLVHAVPVTLWEVHGEADWKGVELRGLFAEGHIGNVDSVNAAQGFTNAKKNSVGGHLWGGYLQAAHDILPHFTRTEHYLAPFFRYERYDTQDDTPSAFAKNPANSKVEYTAGVTYKPIPKVVAKFDYQWIFDQARTGVNQMNLGLGYEF